MQLGICAFDTILYPSVLTALFSIGWLIDKRRMLNGEYYPLIPSLPEELRHVQIVYSSFKRCRTDAEVNAEARFWISKRSPAPGVHC